MFYFLCYQSTRGEDERPSPVVFQGHFDDQLPFVGNTRNGDDRQAGRVGDLVLADDHAGHADGGSRRGKVGFGVAGDHVGDFTNGVGTVIVQLGDFISNQGRNQLEGDSLGKVDHHASGHGTRETDDPTDFVFRLVAFFQTGLSQFEGHVDHRIEKILDRVNERVDVLNVHDSPIKWLFVAVECRVLFFSPRITGG
ncbi:hypothetical protein DESC_260037 [Desulfosarcina cetonica]|nr:hypothetical protein DESC_260037 [Desulfosarcina cetonica]